MTFLRLLGTVPVNLSIEVQPASYWFDRADAMGCQVADSAYVALAHDLDVALATFDGGMATAALARKVKLYF